MPDSANETLTPAEYRQKYAGGSTPDGGAPPHRRFDQAIAIDPGKTAGLAWTNGHRTLTNGLSDFWTLCDATWMEIFGVPAPSSLFASPDDLVIILEAPYKSRPGMGAGQSVIAYRSGQVAREAELIQQRFAPRYTVIEHDPSQQGRKWDDAFARQVVGDWEGPSNSDTRDAIRLLFFYNFL